MSKWKLYDELIREIPEELPVDECIIAHSPRACKSKTKEFASRPTCRLRALLVKSRLSIA